MWSSPAPISSSMRAISKLPVSMTLLSCSIGPVATYGKLHPPSRIAEASRPHLTITAVYATGRCRVPRVCYRQSRTRPAMFELFVARRYLRAKRKQVVISVITIISVIGVAAGVMALVIAMAIQNGFRNTLEHDLLSATAPVSVLSKEAGVGIEDWQQIAAKLARLPHVKAVAPGLYEPGLLSLVTSEGMEIKGVPMTPGSPVPDLLRHLKSGSIADVRAAPGERPGIILGARLADSIGAVQGKPVRLIIPDGKLTPLGPEPSFETLRVAGIFESGFYDVDLHWAYMTLEDAQRVFRVGDVVNALELQIDDIFNNAAQVASQADAAAGPKLAATT